MNGKVTYFNNDKGYGFLRDENNVDAFVHITDLSGCKDPYPALGQKVTYDVQETPRGFKAVNARCIVEGVSDANG